MNNKELQENILKKLIGNTCFSWDTKEDMNTGSKIERTYINKIKKAIQLTIAEKDAEIKELKQMYEVRNDDAKDYSKTLTILEKKLKMKNYQYGELSNKFATLKYKLKQRDAEVKQAIKNKLNKPLTMDAEAHLKELLQELGLGK